MEGLMAVVEEALGMLSRHIFYYLVERSPGDWTEENIGEKFLLLLRHQSLFILLLLLLLTHRVRETNNFPSPQH